MGHARDARERQRRCARVYNGSMYTHSRGAANPLCSPCMCVRHIINEYCRRDLSQVRGGDADPLVCDQHQVGSPHPKILQQPRGRAESRRHTCAIIATQTCNTHKHTRTWLPPTYRCWRIDFPPCAPRQPYFPSPSTQDCSGLRELQALRQRHWAAVGGWLLQTPLQCSLVTGAVALPQPTLT